MIDLSARQIQILRAIIQEFIETAEPVGSDTIDRKYNIGVSPATIRNEMVQLTKQGYLNKTHSSAGRVPTPIALKLYVNELMKEKELTVADEVSAKEKIWHTKNEIDDLLSELTKVLADRSKALGLTVFNDKRIISSGHANLLNMPEFYDINVMRQVLSMIEEVKVMQEIFAQSSSDNQVHVIYGTELGNKNLEPIGLIHMSFMVKGCHCQIGVLGSSRFDYAYIIPMMKYIRSLVKEMVE
jgi:heat-inducible transcriptional repressor